MTGMSGTTRPAGETEAGHASNRAVRRFEILCRIPPNLPREEGAIASPNFDRGPNRQSSRLGPPRSPPSCHLRDKLPYASENPPLKHGMPPDSRADQLLSRTGAAPGSRLTITLQRSSERRPDPLVRAMLSKDFVYDLPRDVHPVPDPGRIPPHRLNVLEGYVDVAVFARVQIPPQD